MATKAKEKFNTIDEYMMSLSEQSRTALQEVRTVLLRAIPEAEEVISYNIPALKNNGIILYFAGWKEHISIYPRTAAMEQILGDELTPYSSAKGTLKFPFNQALPLELIRKLATIRRQEHLQQQEMKAAKKQKKL